MADSHPLLHNTARRANRLTNGNAGEGARAEAFARLGLVAAGGARVAGPKVAVLRCRYPALNLKVDKGDGHGGGALVVVSLALEGEVAAKVGVAGADSDGLVGMVC